MKYKIQVIVIIIIFLVLNIVWTRYILKLAEQNDQSIWENLINQSL